MNVPRPMITQNAAAVNLFKNVKYLLSESSPKNLGECAAEIAFAGRSNVGKSTLINALCRNNLARTSSTPGRTRTINVFLAGRDRWIVDLPGYGYAEGPRAERAAWGTMIEGYLVGRPTLRMIFVLIDAKVGPTTLDLQMRDWLNSKTLPWRAIATKADQVKKSRVAGQKQEIASVLGLKLDDLLWVSANEGLGIKELRAEAAALLKN